MPIIKFTFKIILLLTMVTGIAFAQPIDLNPDRFAFEGNLRYQNGMDSPADFLNYELGSQFTIYDKVIRYFQYLSQKSDKIEINQYGETYEGRPLYNLVISSPENLANIERLQKRHLSLMDSELPSDERADIFDNDPVFTSFSYNIHGNEAASSEAAMQIAYRLAAAEDTAMDEVLGKSVIILFVCINPDGRDRYVHWINGVGRNIPGVNPHDLEHYAPWPNGRTNHYWFDLNRDWVWGVHAESRGHIAEYQKWMPQVHIDYHEQGYHANYFTAPGATPRNLLLPDAYEGWSETFGNANVSAFDKEGIMYFTHDRFDFFYPGYGSSYPSVMGAIGMLTEQGGIGAGRAVETDDGYVLTLRQRIFDHYTTSLASIKTAAAQRESLLRYSANSWNPAMSKSSINAYVIRAEEGGYIKDFLQVLDRNKIEVHRLKQPLTLEARDYWSGDYNQQVFTEGDYVVLSEQPRHLFVHSILARNMAIEDSVMYDMSTWSAPLAYNLAAYSIEDFPKVAMQPITEEDLVHKGVLINEQLKNRAVYAYLIDWNERWAPKALSLLWDKGYRVRTAIEPFSDGERTFSAGTLIVLRGRNLEKESELHEDMADIAAAAQCRIYAMPTGRMRSGYDLASSRNKPLKKPRVAMLVEPPFSTYTSGQVYFLFDQETAFGVDRIRTTAFSQTSLPKFGQRYGYTDISDYDVLILPGGGRHLKRLFWKDQLYELRQWLDRGGTLIALESSSEYFTANNKFGKVKLKEPAKDTSRAIRYLEYAENEHYHGLRRIPGSALKASIDITHPLGFGVKPRLFDLKLGTTALLPSAELQSVGVYHHNAAELLVAGYASEENLEHLAGTTFAGVYPIGKGRVVYLLDNPHYRMFWRGASRMMQNAAMLLPAF